MRTDMLANQWALVTGASSGIGEAMAEVLAEQRANLILIARREELLRTLSDRLTAHHRVQTRIWAADLCQPSVVEELPKRAAAEGIAIRMLCNIAGCGHWGSFDRHSPEEYARTLQLNLHAPVKLCLGFLPQLTSHATSVIINASSPAAYQPVPYMAVYAASKAGLHSFSLALHEEFRSRGVLVQTLVPGPTESEFDRLAGAYDAKVLADRRPPREVALAALAGLRTGTPIAAHAKGLVKQRLFAGLAPVSMVLREVSKMFRPPG